MLNKQTHLTLLRILTIINLLFCILSFVIPHNDDSIGHTSKLELTLKKQKIINIHAAF